MVRPPIGDAKELEGSFSCISTKWPLAARITSANQRCTARTGKYVGLLFLKQVLGNTDVCRASTYFSRIVDCCIAGHRTLYTTYLEVIVVLQLVRNKACSKIS